LFILIDVAWAKRGQYHRFRASYKCQYNNATSSGGGGCDGKPAAITAFYPFLAKQPSPIETERTQLSKLSLAMQRYTLADTLDRNSEVFEKVATEPV
jgi:hypothetical protein